MSDRPAITQQYAFTVNKDGETDGGIEPTEQSVETSLKTFGAEVDHRERDSRIDQPKASRFGVDDRKTVTRDDGGDQRALFADTDEDQQTLTGERAASQCLFATDEADDEPADTTDGDPPTERAETTDETPPRALADGGRDVAEDPTGNAEETDEDAAVTVAIPRMELAEVADYVEYERNTVERHAGDGPKTEELTEYVEECRSALSVLGEDGRHGHINRVTAAGAADALHVAADRHADEYAEKLRRVVEGLRRALDDQPQPSADAEPAANAEPESESEDVDTTFDAEAETVTDAWEGAFISTSWGYDQTNVELAQIVDVSDTGKTVLARLVGAERVEHGRTSEHLRPTAEPFGDEFRLHVRSVQDDPVFRGSYPLGNDGDLDGPTRRGSFYPFDNNPENSIRRTAPNHGH